MEQLIAEVRAYAEATNKSPEKVLREAIGASWGAWAAWQAGTSGPTMRSADRLRAFMTANPAPAKQEDTAC
ncbi:hypothetical protein [Rhodovulum sulfidophilum]|uniref:Uncharacterized protein n=1 Tax=Rhodovulum sulfidophilum TaxID=35806 RepID=A0ABS1RYI5_RHOSU|nr:hypothetical protein [Rhodovulum sulfidophilum]MBL3575335.1 hypothetical protein [Rhodovulum sulfidophilum]MBL3611145.1 hypothetical protein [Rhodovulum sulfidophilum]MCE8432627.1 hypothetical protein [Rhodovulum sulfidophilum]MCE8442180.1 hypothetical protein [Rhodovulum sulfidophilum]MCE8455532.1 hypothetical protein [Rhodovulum sulfidophilum]